MRARSTYCSKRPGASANVARSCRTRSSWKASNTAGSRRWGKRGSTVNLEVGFMTSPKRCRLGNWRIAHDGELLDNRRARNLGVLHGHLVVAVTQFIDTGAVLTHFRSDQMVI